MTVTCATKVAIRNRFVTTLRFPIVNKIYSNYFINKNLVIFQNKIMMKRGYYEKYFITVNGLELT